MENEDEGERERGGTYRVGTGSELTGVVSERVLTWSLEGDVFVLGVNPYLPTGYVVGTWWVLKQNTQHVSGPLFTLCSQADIGYNTYRRINSTRLSLPKLQDPRSAHGQL